MKTMNLNQLINDAEILKAQGKGSMKLMVSSDEEGNSFHTLWSPSIRMYGNNLMTCNFLIGADYNKCKRDKNGLPIPVTLNVLLNSLKKIKVFYEHLDRQDRLNNAEVYITDDDEINGIHGCYFTFSPITEDYDSYQFHDVDLDEAMKHYLILG